VIELAAVLLFACVFSLAFLPVIIWATEKIRNLVGLVVVFFSIVIISAAFSYFLVFLMDSIGRETGWWA